MPSAEIWVRDNTLIDNLGKVLASDIQNIRELIEFEKGLRFAVQRLKDLEMLKFEYLANPYYMSHGEECTTNDIYSDIEKLTQTLQDIDGKSHNGLHEKLLKSFSTVKFKWEKIYETGSINMPSGKINEEEIADRHFGFFGF